MEVLGGTGIAAKEATQQGQVVRECGKLKFSDQVQDDEAQSQPAPHGEIRRQRVPTLVQELCRSGFQMLPQVFLHLTQGKGGHGTGR